MNRVMQAAKKLNVRVVGAHIDGDVLGFYDANTNTIYFDLSLCYDERVSVIAHELGHVYYGHDCTNQRAEDQADAFAARLLIDPARYAEAEAVSTDVNYLADELDVSTDIIYAFRKFAFQKLGLRTYVRSPQVA